MGPQTYPGALSVDPVHICSRELSLQENLIGALLAIFGHLVVSIALNLQVSKCPSPALLAAETQPISGCLICLWVHMWASVYAIPRLGL